MEDEDKHSLKGIEYGEEVRHHNGGLIYEEETEGPCEAQQTQQCKGAHDPGSEDHKDKHTHSHMKTHLASVN